MSKHIKVVLLAISIVAVATGIIVFKEKDRQLKISSTMQMLQAHHMPYGRPMCGGCLPMSSWGHRYSGNILR